MSGKYSPTPNTPFMILAAGIMILLTLPMLIQDGMFMDAMLYTSVAHNLGMGIGTFWFPEFSVYNIAGLPSFHEQPPLVFGIQALFFQFLGDSMYVERFYTFLTMLVTAVLIVILWKEIFRENKTAQNAGWLPVILWITIPVCFWSFSNNMHENTMGLFTLASVIFAYKGFHSVSHGWFFAVFSGVMLFFATLSKGIPGFFPLAVPILYWITTRKIPLKRAMWMTAILVSLPLIIYLILFLIPESRESLSIYLFKRALHRISEVPTVDSRFYILGRLLTELAPQIVFVCAVFFFGRKKIQPSENKFNAGEAVFFLLTGLSASLPLMLTLVQKGFYFVPALPFFAIGISMIIAEKVGAMVQVLYNHRRKYLSLLIFSVLFLAGSLVFSFLQAGKVRRDRDMLHDVYLVGSVVPKGSLVSVPSSMWSSWEMQCYMMRYFNISFEKSYRNRYLLTDRQLHPDSLSGYQKVGIATLQFDLYRKK